MICRRIEGIKPFIVMDVLERAQKMECAGESIIHLEIGEPDFETPEAIKSAAIDALHRGETRYTHSLGNAKLREAVCAYYSQTYGITRLEPDQVLITSGTSPAFLIAMSTLLECGEEVILSNPHYACYPNFITFLEGVPRTVAVYEEDGFQYRPEVIKAALSPRTRAILVNSPANPTGNQLEPQRMAEIADLGKWVLSDEIYHGLVYAGRARSMLEFTDKCIVFNGFSKLFAMTGWRLGYLIVPKNLVRPMQKMLQNFFISANSVAQAAACVALTDASVKADVEHMRSTFDKRRRFMIRRLREMGFGITVEPTGAFYVFANAAKFTNDSYAFAFDVLEKAKVGITPGIDFGSNGEGYVRFSYANSLENIAQGLDRIEQYLASIKPGKP
ncbi:pyridoxal phosphate-dependent aminotransferase [Desulfoferrobacter suflitae]|uniref:pyridoxal phosphate-dependent aminotransferase n=1 Tax=Desulfoferrobacter suflitae TaxID=2865782 RepID=UPI0021640614|nr:pyridoxal phosphate-dependent aminotransferase [Desulfoferrobacter suflitae]MCK8600893.1 pyridoxal phosphate-dependent aminotransferase [Desulfoferrobacter suflitae]